LKKDYIKKNLRSQSLEDIEKKTKPIGDLSKKYGKDFKNASQEYKKELDAKKKNPVTNKFAKETPVEKEYYSTMSKSRKMSRKKPVISQDLDLKTGKTTKKMFHENDYYTRREKALGHNFDRKTKDVSEKTLKDLDSPKVKAGESAREKLLVKQKASNSRLKNLHDKIEPSKERDRVKGNLDKSSKNLKRLNDRSDPLTSIERKEKANKLVAERAAKKKTPNLPASTRKVVSKTEAAATKKGLKFGKKGKIGLAIAGAAGAAYAGKKIYDKKKKKKLNEAELFARYESLNEFGIRLPFFGKKKDNGKKDAHKYFKKTLKRANKGKATSGDVDRARRVYDSFNKKQTRDE
jgi:hypothetical protein